VSTEMQASAALSENMCALETLKGGLKLAARKA
jgi:hypothetical protein